VAGSLSVQAGIRIALIDVSGHGGVQPDQRPGLLVPGWKARAGHERVRGDRERRVV
jgi:hypothetical protein